MLDSTFVTRARGVDFSFSLFGSVRLSADTECKCRLLLHVSHTCMCTFIEEFEPNLRLAFGAWRVCDLKHVILWLVHCWRLKCTTAEREQDTSEQIQESSSTFLFSSTQVSLVNLFWYFWHVRKKKPNCILLPVSVLKWSSGLRSELGRNNWDFIFGCLSWSLYMNFKGLTYFRYDMVY